MPRRLVRVAWLGAAALLGPACAVEDADVAVDEQTIIGGFGDDAEGDVAVGALMIEKTQACSVTLIAPTVALTAAHCLPPHSHADPQQLRVFFGQNLEQDGLRVSVLDATPHPLWTPYILGYDIGLVRLARPVQIEAKPLSVRPPDPLAVGGPARVVGFGVRSETTLLHEVRRSGIATVDEISPFSLRLVPDEAITCTGDSGGPTLLVRDGVEYVAGVHSRSDCETRSIEERVDVHMASFIEPYLAAAYECGLNYSCDLPCTRGEPCEIDCDRDDICEAPRAPLDEPGGCAVGGGRTAGAGPVLVALLALGMRRRRRYIGAPRSFHRAAGMWMR